MNLLDIRNVSVDYTGPHRREIRTVSDVSFSIQEGESVGLVGESGCGKTTLANAIVGLKKLSAGEISFRGEKADAFDGSDLKGFRRHVQMIFQDPFGSLNPRMTIGAAIEEVIAVHRLADSPLDRRRKVAELLQQVGLEGRYADRYPHEFSGGQRQRIGIARALAVSPSLIVADEPVSALDVSVQVQILNLMLELQKRMGLAYLLIAHDLAVVHYMCRRILVMYLGRIVEEGPSDAVFEKPGHPYTEALLSAVPDVERGLQSPETRRTRIVLTGDVPSPGDSISGCPFHPRCHRAETLCRERVPLAVKLGGHRWSACHFAERVVSG